MFSVKPAAGKRQLACSMLGVCLEFVHIDRRKDRVETADFGSPGFLAKGG
jgi:hypothetical protein